MDITAPLGVVARIAACAGALLSGGCAWIGLTWGALTYPTTQAGEAANVIAHGAYAYVTRGAAGVEILPLRGGTPSRLLALPPTLESADDLAIADGLLFVLDAQPPGHLAVFSLQHPALPALRGAPAAVDVGPFSGVTAADGLVIVSGGTAPLSLRRYAADGSLGEVAATADLGRGQPDALLARGGLAFVSTHTFGPQFELSVVHASDAGVERLAAVPLETFGFTPGGAKPANFPVETAVTGDTLFVATAAGLNVIDVSRAAAPRVLALLPLPVQAVNVDVRDGVAAVVGSAPAPQLVLVDVRDPARPEILQSFPLPEGSRATGVALTASHAVVAAHGRGVLLLARASGAWEQAGPPAHVIPSPTTKESKS